MFVDIDDTLVRSFGSKRIAMTSMVARVRALHAEAAVPYAWSSGGGVYARDSAEALGLAQRFVAYRPKPDVFVDDVQLHPNETDQRTVEELRALAAKPR